MKREAAELGVSVDALSRELAAERPRINVVILCNGDQARLTGVLNYPKHFVDVAGEPNLRRTVRLVRELADGHISICGKVGPGADPRWHMIAAEFGTALVQTRDHTMTLDGSRPVTKVGAIRPSSIWPDEGEVLVLMGDVVWHRYDLERILRDRHPGPIFFGRHDNPFTEKHYPECFAVRATLEQLDPFVELESLWELYGAMARYPFRHVRGFSDDIDTPEDLTTRLPKLDQFAREVE